MALRRKINAGIQMPFTILFILKKLSAQRNFLNAHVKPVLAETEQENDGSLEAADFKKITNYYGLAVPAILGEAFCVLHHKKMSETERIASTSQGAMTGLFDDFFDAEYMADVAVENILNGKNVTPGRSNEKLFEHFYKEALKHVPGKKNMEEALLDVYQAQVESKKQTLSLTKKEILDITLYKGGLSLLFYRTAFSPPPSPREQKLLYSLGGMMQLANDIFDVYRDRENGIKTLVTETRYIAEVRNLMQGELTSCCKEAFKTAFPKKKIRQFLAILSLGIFSRAFVCLEELEKNEASTNNIFSVHEYSRPQLVCDMEKKKNMAKAAKYHLQFTVDMP